MATQGVRAQGTLLKIGDGQSPENFTTVAEVVDITGPSIKLDVADGTSHDSSGDWDESIPTLLHGGDIKITANFIPQAATQSFSSGILRDQVNRNKRNYKLVFTDPNSTTWQFATYVTDYAPKAPTKDKLSLDATLKITGQPTLA
jgi:hypothetical protein